MKREHSSLINWILDNLFPPIFRDSRIFMGPLFQLVFGGKKKYFLEFKQKAFALSDKEIAGFYDFLADKHIKRITDIHRLCVPIILDQIVGSSVLDIACGKGYLSLLIGENKNMEVTGMDFSPPVLESKPNVRFIQGTIENIAFPDNHFDTVVCAHTIEHVRDINKAISELRRVAAKRLIIIVPRQREYKYTFDLHINFFPYDHCLKRVMNNPEARVTLIGNDFYYQEDVGKV